MRSVCAAIFVVVAVIVMSANTSVAADEVAGNLIQFNENGAWCWYQDPRLVVDPVNNTLLVSSIATADGFDGKERRADVDVVAYQFATGARTRFVLHHHFDPQDDHNAAALLIRPDGRYLAMYALHNHENLTYWRISTKPHDANEWGPEQTFDWTSAIKAAGAHSHVTYSNLFYLTTEKRTYDFSRAINDDPSMLISADQGDHWSYAGKLLTETKLGYVNGYTKYASNGTDRIDFITTEHHPRDFNNSIYHGYIQGGKLYRSDGTVVDDDIFHSPGHPQTELTKVFSANSMFDGTIMTHAWTIELAVDSGGRPYGVISARANDEPENTNFQDHRFFYIRFDGKVWQVNELAKAGACLWPAEQDYTGLATVDPSDPNIVYISTTVDPRNDSALARHEIFQGQTSDLGKKWSWTPITQTSTVDNLRPLAVASSDGTVLVWFRGTMSRSQHYDAAMVGTIIGKDESAGKVHFASNNIAAVPGEASKFKVNVDDLKDGTYDLFAFFWSAPGEDRQIGAGLALDQMMQYRTRGCQTAEASQFAYKINPKSADRMLYRAYLGRVTAKAGQPVAVYVEDAGPERIFGGIGYAKAD
ncbi:MAG TPA: BNR-4 repeat-containing protein [Tepidisphaeraceae bacterium]|jgi:hypothetical protein|nr:BNR-4 repeat-containing protein [Tepidisphaeraceae bacterium]